MPESIVYNMDCMEGMKQYPDKYFDLAIVDPPYGIGVGNVYAEDTKVRSGSKAMRGSFKVGWDNSAPNEDYFFELFRVSKNQIIWGANHFISKMPFDSAGWVYWDKDNGTNDFSDGELAFSSFNKGLRRIKLRWNGMLQHDMKNKETRIHPTQKPIALYKWLLQNYAKAGNKILDTHLGSGSSRIATYDMGFDFTGYELDTDYYLAQEKRFKNHIAQQSLFVPETQPIITQTKLL